MNKIILISGMFFFSLIGNSLVAQTGNNTKKTSAASSKAKSNVNKKTPVVVTESTAVNAPAYTPPLTPSPGPQKTLPKTNSVVSPR